MGSRLRAALQAAGGRVPEWVRARNGDVVWVLGSALLGLVVLLLVLWLGGKIGRGRAGLGGRARDLREPGVVVVCGPSARGAEESPGKTALIKTLKHGAMPPLGLVTTMKCSESRFTPKGWDPAAARSRRDAYTFVDVGGHASMALDLTRALCRARAVVVVLDARKASFMASLRDSGQCLYDVMTHPTVSRFQTPILIFCNKSDAKDALDERSIRELLRAEINRERKSRESEIGTIHDVTAAEAQRVPDASTQNVYLGYEGEEFQFDHAFGPVLFSRGSVLATSLEPIQTFVQAHA
ncbi:Signal recognition particle receptor subunit beta [Porphyridium purpureum]|uniref:Signal recognition particle receptor subunit beta n=1 Tax=Porphyridium purpureum TaxID=35688 RepID=A0A5J4YQF5_PORPP|nr:Signal recognition particle receptor subunit beta [Porphyridium purpureum]|eukprot:POR8818..scf222_8